MKCISGKCVEKQQRQCYLDRHVYRSGQSFNISCTMTCKCMDGHLGCSPRCKMQPPPKETVSIRISNKKRVC